MSDNCPTCSQPVRVITGDEGTSHYEPVTDTIRISRKDAERLNAHLASNRSAIGRDAELWEPWIALRAALNVDPEPPEDCDDLCTCGCVRHEHHYFPDPVCGPETGGCPHSGCERFKAAPEPLRSPGCPFCDYAGPNPILHDWGEAIAIEPLNPVTPGHVLVIPKAHVVNFACSPLTTANAMQRAAEYAAVQGGDWNLIASKGPSATQTVGHLHVHLIPRRKDDGLSLPWSEPPRYTLAEVREGLLAVNWRAVNADAETQCPSRDHRPLACARCVTRAALDRFEREEGE